MSHKTPCAIHGRRKPQWVVETIIRYEALMPQALGYTIAHNFNAQHRVEPVSKSYVYTVFRQHAYDIAQVCKRFKNKPPYPVQFNQTWDIDLTFVNKQSILGIVEHHSRKAVDLIPL